MSAAKHTPGPVATVITSNVLKFPDLRAEAWHREVKFAISELQKAQAMVSLSLGTDDEVFQLAAFCEWDRAMDRLKALKDNP